MTDTRVIHISVPGDPVAKGRPRFAAGRAYTPAKTLRWEELAKWSAAAQYGPLPPVDGAVRLTVTARFTIPKSWSRTKRAKAIGGVIKHTSRPDADNLLKAVGDAMNGVLWLDDSQVCEARVEKLWGETPGVYIMVECLT